MELKDFTKQTIIQITEGVIDGHKHIIELGGEGIADEYHPVNFDVAVVSDEEAKTDLAGKISVASIFSGGAGSEKIQKNTNHSHIQFRIQIHIATSKYRRR